MWSIHTMDYYLTVKRNKVLVHVATYVNLENFMLNERSQSQKSTLYDSLYMKCPEWANL